MSETHLLILIFLVQLATFILVMFQGFRAKDIADDNQVCMRNLATENIKSGEEQKKMFRLVREFVKWQQKRAKKGASDKAEVIDGQFKLAELLMTGLKANTEYQNTFKAEVIDGQFKLAELLTTGLKANTEYQNTLSKNQIDSVFDAITKNTDDVLKLSTENSQKVYDAMVIMIQMMNNLMKALGYRPALDPEDAGLQDPKKGPSYNKPPAPEEQDGLTYAR